MVARNEEKMKSKAQEIQNAIPYRKNIKFVFITADLMKMDSCEKFRTLLEERIKDLDIGVVIANAGAVYGGCYHWLDDL